MSLPTPDSWLALAIAYLPAMVLAVIWHEAGHVIAARLVGIRVIRNRPAIERCSLSEC